MLKLLAAAAILVPGLVVVDGKRTERQAERVAELDRAIRLRFENSNSAFGWLGSRVPRTLAQQALDRIWALKIAAAKGMVAASYKK